MDHIVQSIDADQELFMGNVIQSTDGSGSFILNPDSSIASGSEALVEAAMEMALSAADTYGVPTDQLGLLSKAGAHPKTPQRGPGKRLHSKLTSAVKSKTSQ
eukprot:SAG22_NODE_2631_length_2355_cov_3.262411_2_plen_102_part_00